MNDFIIVCVEMLAIGVGCAALYFGFLYIGIWRAYRRLRTLRRGDLQTLADVKRELGL